MRRHLKLVLPVLVIASVLAALPASGAVVTCGGMVATSIGTAGPDVLIGTSGVDVIVGLGGDDIIRGFEGNDLLCGNAGDDLIIGGGGADWISGGPGDDWLRGKKSGDTLLGGKGHDALNGGPGADTLDGGNHRDVVRGGAKNDRMIGAGGEDTLIGGGGNDIARGGPATDFCDAETEATCEAINLATRLHATGIGSQLFGDLADSALLEFAALLGDAADEGDPDEDSGWIGSFSGFGTCPNDEVRVVRWGDVEIFNTRAFGMDGTFFTWEIYDPANDRGNKELMTARGIRWGDTMAQLDVAYGNRLTTDYIDIWDLHLFYVDADPSGLRGTLTGGEYADTIFLLGGGIGCGE